jgi:soluble cytochrome b562
MDEKRKSYDPNTDWRKKNGFKKKISLQERSSIKRILGMAIQQPFPKCPGKGGTCKRTAGHGTYGDFYGLGDHVGHFGVGHCIYHESYKSKERVWQFARRHMDAIRTFHAHAQPVKEFEKLAELEANEAEKYSEMRRGLDLLVSTLKEFEKMVKDGELTEYVAGAKGEGAQLAPASVTTRINLACQIAKTITAAKLNDFKMKSNDYIHVDEIIRRMPRMISLGKKIPAKVLELKANFKDGNRDPVEQANEEYLEGMKEIWKDMKTGEQN